jgi:hypothetical protein
VCHRNDGPANFLLQNATSFQWQFVASSKETGWSSIAAIAKSNALVITITSFMRSKCCSTGALVNLSLRSRKACSTLAGHDHGLFYLVRPFLLFVLRTGVAEFPWIVNGAWAAVMWSTISRTIAE